MLQEVLTRVGSSQPVPSVGAQLGLLAVALLLVVPRPLWRVSRMLVTIVHESGHAVAAVLTGRRLSGIRLHSDTSGLTVSRGRPRGPGMVATLLAGYPAAAVFGVATAAVLGTGRAVAFLWVVLALLALMLLQVRNFYGLLVLLVVGGTLGAATWLLPETYLSWLAHLIAWVMLLAAPRPVVELVATGRHPSSDAGQLARLTAVPERLWQLLFLLVTTAGTVVGAALMLPLAEWYAGWVG
ncbi:M50 family peptidase [Auraticoccus sp. F435]|uniref:M50 family peptidase n=1 Tax=Auraticoccus cholistanensis TaxID=2656650 RepID=A0A6A9UTS6_9ACTN|nr:M50 family metallopeptidase [Auraticoccus cholistanensis]MVA76336.1 M50 family peptidase [Auraticoccus cholistanensis]